MSRIVIIGGSGHVGSYLVPLLVELGHCVINVSRGTANPYRPHFSWDKVENVTLDRVTEEKAGLFGAKIAALNPDIVIDMISFDLDSTRQIVEALRGKVEHYLFCSSIWVYGRYVTVPSTEAEPVSPIDDYGRGKAESEAWLMREARLSGFPVTCFRPGHIVGEGWVPTTPQGNSNPDVFTRIAHGEALSLPNLGHETLHHVHALDVAQFIIRAIDNRAVSEGEIFNVVSEQAVTLRGYAETVYRWFGKEPALIFQPFEEWLNGLETEYAENSRGHVVRSSSHSIAKAVRRLGYQPQYGSLEAIQESVQTLISEGKVFVPGS
ncbi:NAD-dependent epimerase/dehydratase family protein [Brenneria populi subsp. brevivirga]|uniref:NAD-dependent epimerase/dehydratase family protein n=1 Tax=Brenneria populi TaxID=1505588 RepID=UPI002E175027|nr:NAD-dependent epimerase/dehydratase family protein [Brenneria populi subsp. brevivirga]